MSKWEKIGQYTRRKCTDVPIYIVIFWMHTWINPCGKQTIRYWRIIQLRVSNVFSSLSQSRQNIIFPNSMTFLTQSFKLAILSILSHVSKTCFVMYAWNNNKNLSEKRLLNRNILWMLILSIVLTNKAFFFQNPLW